MAANSEHAATTARLGPRRHDAYYLRLLTTGVSFLLFGVGALCVGAVLLPLVRLLPAEQTRKRMRARAVMSRALRLFTRLMYGSLTMTYEFRGAERLGRPGQLIVANHPTLIDVVFLLGFTPDANCVVKQGLWRNPLTRGAVTLAEFIPNDPTAEMIDTASSALQAGQTLIMFPEGTRTRPHEPLVFHRGAANVALRAARVVTPVYIRCEPTTLTKGEPWYQIPLRRPRFTLIVGADFDLQPYRSQALPLASRALNRDLQAHFEAELARGA